jgi:hypothetical protein
MSVRNYSATTGMPHMVCRVPRDLAARMWNSILMVGNASDEAERNELGFCNMGRAQSNQHKRDFAICAPVHLVVCADPTPTVDDDSVTNQSLWNNST